MFFRSRSVKGISPRELHGMMQKGDQLFLLDVRQPLELREAGTIPGVVNIPLGELQRRVGELPEDHDATIISICRSGARSMSAAYFLADLGYKNVYNLDGGTMAWLRSGVDVR